MRGGRTGAHATALDRPGRRAGGFSNGVVLDHFITDMDKLRGSADGPAGGRAATAAAALAAMPMSLPSLQSVEFQVYRNDLFEGEDEEGDGDGEPNAGRFFDD